MSTDDPSRTIAATLTPTGRGAVAVIGLRGQLAEAALTKHFQRSGNVSALAATPLRRILYGTWLANTAVNGPREDVVLTRFETHWELGCHGGAIASAAILTDLNAAGIETISWQEWLTLTAKNRLQASAATALAAAQSSAAALALLRAAELTESEICQLCRELENPSQDTKAEPQARLQTLLSTACWAKHLTQPWKIVLAGLPNAGKSSLLNALVGYERAIVFEQPGTTRDVVTAAAAYDGWRWELRDTAGLRATEDSLEAAGIERTNAMLAASDVTVLIIDGTRPWRESEPLRRAQPQAIVVRNKADLWTDNKSWENEALAEPLVPRASSQCRDSTALGRDAQETLAVSAVTGAGLEELRAAIHQRLALPAWPALGALVWDAILEHDLRTLQKVIVEDPAALPAALGELRTWTQ